MIREFMKSNTQNNFVIITNINDKILSQREEKLHFRLDGRIRFIGTVYDRELLLKIRENAYAYFHSHEVDGTSPSLLGFLGSTNRNLLLDVAFKREVSGDAALYWTKGQGNLAVLIDNCERMLWQQVNQHGTLAKERTQRYYNWQFIAERYETIFCSGVLADIHN